MERNSSKDLILQGQTLADFHKIDVLIDFAKFTGKHLDQNMYLIKLQAFSLPFYCKKYPNADVFLRILCIFLEHLVKELFRATTSDCSRT